MADTRRVIRFASELRYRAQEIKCTTDDPEIADIAIDVARRAELLAGGLGGRNAATQLVRLAERLATAEEIVERRRWFACHSGHAGKLSAALEKMKHVADTVDRERRGYTDEETLDYLLLRSAYDEQE